MGDNRNLASLIRNDSSMKEHKKKVAGQIEKSGSIAFNVHHTKKGRWSFYIKESEGAGEVAFGVYERKDGREYKPSTFFCRKFEDCTLAAIAEAMNDTAGRMTERVLEQRLKNWPLRGLNADTGEDYLAHRGIAAVMTYIIIDGGLGYARQVGTFNHLKDYTDSLPEPIGTVVLGVGALGSILTAFGAVCYLATKKGRQIGERMDMIRSRALPKDYSYGKEVETALRGEYSTEPVESSEEPDWELQPA
ncbi:MAG: hypothetical protein ABIE94_01250 [archaeon]